MCKISKNHREMQFFHKMSGIFLPTGVNYVLKKICLANVLAAGTLLVFRSRCSGFRSSHAAGRHYRKDCILWYLKECWHWELLVPASVKYLNTD